MSCYITGSMIRIAHNFRSTKQQKNEKIRHGLENIFRHIDCVVDHRTAAPFCLLCVQYGKNWTGIPVQQGIMETILRVAAGKNPLHRPCDTDFGIDCRSSIFYLQRKEKLKIIGKQ